MTRGFIWFCTADGLSRFDGYSFTNFGVDHGLPHSEVMDLLETREREYWLATTGGLVRFNPKSPPEHRVVYENDVRPGAKPMFTVVVPLDRNPFSESVTVLLQDQGGEIWCGTRRGVHRLEIRDDKFTFRPVDIGMPADWGEGCYITDLLEAGTVLCGWPHQADSIDDDPMGARRTIRSRMVCPTITFTIYWKITTDNCGRVPATAASSDLCRARLTVEIKHTYENSQ